MAEAVAAALKRFPDFRAARANRRAALELVDQARGAYYPSADLTLGVGRELSDNPATRALQARRCGASRSRRKTSPRMSARCARSTRWSSAAPAAGPTCSRPPGGSRSL